MRSSTVKGYWTGGGGGKEPLEAEKVVATPAKKIVGFGVEEL
jgi:hypothetical protein